MRVSLIVAAGGSGTRFKPPSPGVKTKQEQPSKIFFSLGSRPVLAHSLSLFQSFPEIEETVIAAPKESLGAVEKLVRANQWRKVKVVQGGATRAESVWKALQNTKARNEWVMVHDGARPFISKAVLKDIFREAPNADGVIAAKKVVPTIKEAGEDKRILRTVDRTSLYEAETPQLVRRRMLKKAFQVLPGAFKATDEASMLEALKANVKVVTHEDWNPKITTFKDLELAEAYLSAKGGSASGGNPSFFWRTGFGRDTHRLVPKRKFLLGGIRIPFEKGPLGHSDGDALLHAVCDAMLGAAGAGDIGGWFSDRDPKFKNIPSARMLTEILKGVAEKGWKPEHLDTVIILEKPKLMPYKQKIRANIAKLLGVKEENVSIKAKTAEGLGPEGEGKAITCEALITMKRVSNE